MIVICDFTINLLIQQIISSLTNTKSSPKLQPYRKIYNNSTLAVWVFHICKTQLTLNT